MSLATRIDRLEKNIVINGNFDFWQRVAGNTTTINTASDSYVYTADRFSVFSGGATNKNYSLLRVTDVPTLAQSNFNSTYSLKFNCLTAIASPAASDRVLTFVHRVEGYNYARIHGSQAILSFWVKSSKTGTFPVAFQIASFTRSYVTTFVVNAANTWEKKSIVVTMDSSGSANLTTGIGVSITIAAVTGSTYQAPSLNAWNTGDYTSFAGLANIMDSNTNSMQISQVTLNEGDKVPTFSRTGVDILEELLLCQRYYAKTFPIDTAPANAAGASGMVSMGSTGSSGFGCQLVWRLPVEMRANPSVNTFNPASANSNARNFSATADRTISNEPFGSLSPHCISRTADSTGDTVGQTIGVHYVCDAEL